MREFSNRVRGQRNSSVLLRGRPEGPEASWAPGSRVGVRGASWGGHFPSAHFWSNLSSAWLPSLPRPPPPSQQVPWGTPGERLGRHN